MTGWVVYDPEDHAQPFVGRIRNDGVGDIHDWPYADEFHAIEPYLTEWDARDRAAFHAKFTVITYEEAMLIHMTRKIE